MNVPGVVKRSGVWPRLASQSIGFCPCARQRERRLAWAGVSWKINGDDFTYVSRPGAFRHERWSVAAQFDLQFRVRYQETDAMGRVHHANYLTYFEMGRTELLRASGHTYKQVEEEGFYLVIAEATCRYLMPAFYDDLLTLRTTVAKARGARIEHQYELYRGVELLATGHSVVACVDRQGRVRRLPDWLQVQ
jgi:acyl-CoA thioester hydrolase